MCIRVNSIRSVCRGCRPRVDQCLALIVYHHLVREELTSGLRGRGPRCGTGQVASLEVTTQYICNIFDILILTHATNYFRSSGFFLNKIAKTQVAKNSRNAKLKANFCYKLNFFASKLNNFAPKLNVSELF